LVKKHGHNRLSLDGEYSNSYTSNGSTSNSACVGSALRGLDSALELLAKRQQQQQQEAVEYVAKVTSRQTSRRYA
jgi:hypothetical protein